MKSTSVGKGPRCFSDHLKKEKTRRLIHTSTRSGAKYYHKENNYIKLINTFLLSVLINNPCKIYKKLNLVLGHAEA